MAKTLSDGEILESKQKEEGEPCTQSDGELQKSGLADTGESIELDITRPQQQKLLVSIYTIDILKKIIFIKIVLYKQIINHTFTFLMNQVIMIFKYKYFYLSQIRFSFIFLKTHIL